MNYLTIYIDFYSIITTKDQTCNGKTKTNMDNNSVSQGKIVERSRMLRRKREKILSLPPENALDAIMDAEHPAAVVHSFNDDDFYFLIKDIGTEDSISLLALASDRQWESLLDFEIWNRDRVDITSVAIWMDLFLAADAQRCIKMFVTEKTDFFELFLFKSVEVKIRKHDEDPSELGPDLFTLDDLFYIRVMENINDFNTRFEPQNLFENKDSEGEPGDSFIEKRWEFFYKLLQQLAAYDHITYQNILLESASVISPEIEEEAYRLRNVRLAERGFIPFEEAVGIYKPLTVKQLNKHLKKHVSKTPTHLNLPVPIYPIQFMDEENLFTDSLKTIKEEDAINQICSEFASIANLIISADQKLIENRKGLRDVIKKGCGYINIGLEYLTKKDVKKNRELAAALLQNYTLTEIFRIGYGLAINLKWKADKWRQKSWFVKNGLSLSFWDETWMGILGGLFLKKPFYFDNYKTGTLYREFALSEDIKQTAKGLNQIIEIDSLLSLMNIDPPFTDKLFTYKNFILTLWAKSFLDLPDKTEPLLDIEDLIFFTKSLWETNRTHASKPQKIKNSAKQAFLSWISKTTGKDPYDISAKAGEIFENIFIEIENNMGTVSTKDFDPKYIQLFLVKDREEN